MHEELAAFRTLANMARTGRYEEEALHKAGVGANCPRMQRSIIRMRIIRTAANYSPAVVPGSNALGCTATRSCHVRFANAPRTISTWQ
jgi:hypothetical protein